jgi:hypothetical protein
MPRVVRRHQQRNVALPEKREKIMSVPVEGTWICVALRQIPDHDGQIPQHAG